MPKYVSLSSYQLNELPRVLPQQKAPHLGQTHPISAMQVCVLPHNPQQNQLVSMSPLYLLTHPLKLYRLVATVLPPLSFVKWSVPFDGFLRLNNHSENLKPNHLLHVQLPPPSLQAAYSNHEQTDESQPTVDSLFHQRKQN